MLDTVKINHVQHISFTQSRLTDAVSVILSELLSYEHPSKSAGLFCPSEVRRGVFLSQPCSCTASHAGIPSQPVLQTHSRKSAPNTANSLCSCLFWQKTGEIP